MSSVPVASTRHAPGGHRLRLRRAPARHRGLLVGRPDRPLRPTAGVRSRAQAGARGQLDGRGRADLEGLLARPGHGTDLTDELVALVAEELGVTGCTPMPGALELLAMLRGRTPLGVASNAPRPVFQAAIAAAGRLGLVRARPSAPTTSTGPSRRPTSISRPAAASAPTPADAVALEDTATGLAAARAAGMRTIGVPSVSTVGARGRPRRRLAARPGRPRGPRPR